MQRRIAWPLTAAVSGASLVVGFAVADATGSRPVGGIVLALGVASCALRWRRTAGSRVAALLVGAALLAFIAAHVLAIGFGVPAYPAVLLVAALDALTVLAVAPSRRDGRVAIA